MNLLGGWKGCRSSGLLNGDAGLVLSKVGGIEWESRLRSGEGRETSRKLEVLKLWGLEAETGTSCDSDLGLGFGGRLSSSGGCSLVELKEKSCI